MAHYLIYFSNVLNATKTILKEKLNRKWMTDRKLGADGFMQLGILIAGTTMKGILNNCHR